MSTSTSTRGPNCPTCRLSLESREEGAGGWIVIEACGRCDGLLLDPGELDAMDYSVWTNAEELPVVPTLEDAVGTAGYRDPAVRIDDPTEQPIDCPRCAGSEPMRMGRFVLDADPSIVLERCDRCRALWLAGGMLDRIRDLVGSIDSKIVLGMSWTAGASVSNAAGQSTKKGR